MVGEEDTTEVAIACMLLFKYILLERNCRYKTMPAMNNVYTDIEGTTF